MSSFNTCAVYPVTSDEDLSSAGTSPSVRERKSSSATRRRRAKPPPPKSGQQQQSPKSGQQQSEGETSPLNQKSRPSSSSSSSRSRSGTKKSRRRLSPPPPSTPPPVKRKAEKTTSAEAAHSSTVGTASKPAGSLFQQRQHNQTPTVGEASARGQQDSAEAKAHSMGNQGVNGASNKAPSQQPNRRVSSSRTAKASFRPDSPEPQPTHGHSRPRKSVSTIGNVGNARNLKTTARRKTAGVLYRREDRQEDITPIAVTSYNENARHDGFIHRQNTYADDDNHKVLDNESGSAQKYNLHCERLSFNPTHTAHIVWDWFVIVFIIYNVTVGIAYESFVIPLQERARLTSGVEGQAIGFEILGHISDAVFILDIVVNFRTFLITIDRGQEVLIRDMGAVSAAYLRGFFIVDVLSIGLPFGIIDMISEHASPEDVEVIQRVAYIAGLPKLLRIFRLNWLLGRMLKVSMRTQKYVVLVKLFLLLLVVSHVLGCLYWGIFISREGDAVSRENWMHEAGYDNYNDAVDQWIPTLYFALATLTSVGYGDISGSTTGERGFLIVMMLVGAIIYALILALMTSVMQQVFLADEPLTQKVDILDRFFQLNPIDAELQDKVNNTLEYEWDLQKSFCVQDTLEKLPDALRSKVMLELHKSLILKIPFFAQCEDIFIDALANLLWLEVCLRDTNIIRGGDLNKGMYMINHGEVDVLGVAILRHRRRKHHPNKITRNFSSRNVSVDRLKDGDFFGDVEVCVPFSLNTFTVHTNTRCEYYFIPKDDVMNLFQSFPKKKQLLLHSALRHLSQWIRVLRRQSSSVAVRRQRSTEALASVGSPNQANTHMRRTSTILGTAAAQLSVLEKGSQYSDRNENSVETSADPLSPKADGGLNHANAVGSDESTATSRHWRQSIVLNVIRASHLKAADVGGVSDPYAVVDCANGHRFQTKVQYETVHPYWNEVFIAPLYEKDILQANLSDTAIRVKVVDKDAFGADDFMGQIEITWGELLSAEGTLFPAQWRTLLPKSNLSATSGGSDDNETKQPIPKSADNTAATRVNVNRGSLLFAAEVKGDHINGMQQVEIALRNKLNLRLLIPVERRKCEEHATRSIQKVWRQRLARHCKDHTNPTTEGGNDHSPNEANHFALAVEICKRNILRVATQMGIDSKDELAQIPPVEMQRRLRDFIAMQTVELESETDFIRRMGWHTVRRQWKRHSQPKLRL